MLNKRGNIKVDDQVQKSSFKLYGGETITLLVPDIKIKKFVLNPEPIKMEILYEDDEIIGINKPAGLVVHPGVGNRVGTMANGLIYHFQKLSTLNGKLRPGIVHRLDKDTSGVIIIAKTDYAHANLSKQFETKIVKKEYFGMTWGLWKEKKGKIKTRISRKKSDHTLFEVYKDVGKISTTEYEILEEGRYFSLVKFIPKTGRTHQIRVHSNYKNHPIIGDKKYGGGLEKVKGFTPEVKKIFTKELTKLNRHVLHAKSISFLHPKSHEKLEINAKIPTNLVNLIDAFKKNEL